MGHSKRGTEITSASDWRLKVFPSPIIVDTHPHDCGCTWVWAPSIGLVQYPFVLKFPWRMCRERHDVEYPREALFR